MTAAVVLAMGATGCAPAHASDFAGKVTASSGLNEAQLTLLARSAKVSLSDVQAQNTGPLVTVFANAQPAASDTEMKIDAVFIARALMEGAPAQIASVNIMITRAGKERLVQVSRKQVQDYASGKMNPDQFLASVEMQAATEPLPVESGVEAPRRVRVLKEIQALRQGGTGVASFMSLFKQLEASVKSGETGTQVEEKLTFLEEKLKEQREQITQAKKTARGLGVSRPAGYTVPPDPATQTTASPAANPAYIPPEADHLRSLYLKHADNLIRQLRSKNPQSGTRAAELKKQIDEAFAANQEARAFSLIRQFHTLGIQVAGIDLFAPEGGSVSNTPGSNGGAPADLPGGYPSSSGGSGGNGPGSGPGFGGGGPEAGPPDGPGGMGGGMGGPGGGPGPGRGGGRGGHR